MELSVREFVYSEILDGTHADSIIAQGEMLEDPAELVVKLKRLRHRMDNWIQYFDPENLVEDSPPDPDDPARPSPDG
jgi:hypothetical protein